jgi:hypothetical protein
MGVAVIFSGSDSVFRTDVSGDQLTSGVGQDGMTPRIML